MTTKKRRRPATKKGGAVTNASGQQIVVAVEASARSLVEWTPDLLRSAELLAQTGNLRLAADVCEAMLADDRINGVLSTLVDGLLCLPMRFNVGVGRRKERAKRFQEVEQDWDASFPGDQLSLMVKWGRLLGVGLAQNKWQWRDNGRVIGRIEHYRERFLRYDWTDRQWHLIVDLGNEITIAPGDGQWILYAPYGLSHPWLYGAWRALSRYWLLKQYAIQDWARHSETHGNPWRVAERTEKEAQDSLSAQRRKQLAQDLQEIGRETAFVLPHGYKLSLVEAVAKTWEMFQAQIKLADAGTTIVIAGQNLTTDVSGGSLAAAQVHKEIRGDRIASTDQTLSTTLHDQNLEWWAEYNFAERQLAPWPMHETDPPEDTASVATTWKTAGDALAVWRTEAEAAGRKVDFVAAAEKVGMPLLPEAVPPKTPPGQPQQAADAG